MKKAFTVAELALTVAALCLIAGLIVYAIILGLQEAVRNKRISTAKIKFASAVEMMYLNQAIGSYYGEDEYTTERFVNELQKYIKLVKICKSDEIENCWPYKTLTLADDTKYEIKNARNGSVFGISTNSTTNYNSNTVAIVTFDNTYMLLAYNSRCTTSAPDRKNPNSNQEFNVATACVAGIMDVDGEEKPNKIGVDVPLIYSAGSFADACIMVIDSTCIVSVGTLTGKEGVTKNECLQNMKNWGISQAQCPPEGMVSYWLSAVKECGGWANIASPNEINSILNYMYKDSDIKMWEKNKNLNYIQKSAQKLGLPNPVKKPYYLMSYNLMGNYPNWSINTMEVTPKSADLHPIIKSMYDPKTYTNVWFVCTR